MSELLFALAYLCDTPKPTKSVTDAIEMTQVEPFEHTEIFVFQLVPYASVYLSHDAMLGGELDGRIAGMWSTLGFEIPSEPDHLASLLSLLGKLETETSDSQISPRHHQAMERAMGVVFWEYLAPWVPMYGRKVSELADGTGYQRWGELLVSCIDELALKYRDLGSIPTWQLQGDTSDPSGDAEFDLRMLLVPAVSGMILTRRDLLRCGAETGLGARIGERWFMLRTMLQTNRPLVISWMMRTIESELEELADAQERFGSGIFDDPMARLSRTHHLVDALVQPGAPSSL